MGQVRRLRTMRRESEPSRGRNRAYLGFSQSLRGLTRHSKAPLVGDVHAVVGPGVVRRGDLHSAHDPEEVPAVGDAFQLVLAGVLERQPRAGDEILDRLRD